MVTTAQLLASQRAGVTIQQRQELAQQQSQALAQQQSQALAQQQSQALAQQQSQAQTQQEQQSQAQTQQEQQSVSNYQQQLSDALAKSNATTVPRDLMYSYQKFGAQSPYYKQYAQVIAVLSNVPQQYANAVVEGGGYQAPINYGSRLPRGETVSTVCLTGKAKAIAKIIITIPNINV